MKTVLQKTRYIIFLYFIGCVVYTCAEQSCTKCPGIYCGRTDPEYSNCSAQCSSCVRGYRSDSYFCRKCDDKLGLYDWLYLGFMALTITVLNFFAISAFSQRSVIHARKRIWLLYISTIFETVLSFIFLILMLDPKGEFDITTCEVSSIKDWYTVFFNPILDYRTQHRCTVEAVYPLYTAIFIHLAISFILMVIVRGIIIRATLQNFGRLSFYAGLYVTPAVAATHAAFAGVLYYIFPYLVLFLSTVGIAVFLSRLSSGYFQRLREMKNIAVLVCYFIAHGYGILSVTVMDEPKRDGPLLLLVLLPFLFFTVTRPFTKAENFKHF